MRAAMKTRALAVLALTGLMSVTGMALADDKTSPNSAGMGTPDGSSTGKGAGADVGGDVTSSPKEEQGDKSDK
jgi:hypothetical protein